MTSASSYGPGARRGKGPLALASCILGAALVLAPAPAWAVRLLAFGDSLVQGYGLPPDAGFVPTLERWLAAHGAGDVAVINGGVSGDTTAGGRARIDWSLSDDVDAVLVVLGGNDLLRGFEPTETRRNLSAILEAIRARGLPVLLAGIDAPPNYGPEWEAEFEAIWPDLARRHDALLYPDFFAALRAAPPQEVLQADGIHPNARGVAVIVEDIGPLVLQLIEAARADGRQAGSTD